MTQPEDEDDKAIKLALKAMNEAWETPWVRELIEKRAQEQQEDKERLERARRDGWSLGRAQSDLDPLKLAERAAFYSIGALNHWRSKYPFTYPEPTPDILNDPERYHWWQHSRENSRIGWEFYFEDFCRDILSNYLKGYAEGQAEHSSG